MRVENIKSQIEEPENQAADLKLNVPPDKTDNDPLTTKLAQETSNSTEGLVSADKEVRRGLLLQYAVMRALTESVGTSDAYIKVLQAVCEVMGGKLGVLWVYEAEDDLLNVESIWQDPQNSGSELAKVSQKITSAAGDGLPGTVYLSNKPIWISDILNDADFHPQRRDAALKDHLKNALIFPLRKAGGVMGVIECFECPQQPSPYLSEILNLLGNQIGGFIERKQNEELLAIRVHQQAAVASIGQRALLGIDLQDLLNEAATLAAKTLSVEFSKVLELTDPEEHLLLRAGVGWREGLVGQAYVEKGPQSQGGYSLSTNTPIIVHDLGKETRFRASSILIEHGIVSGLSVIIPGLSKPFGILSAHSTKRRIFTEDDIHFLQAVAHVLGAAIQRKEIEEALLISRNEIAIILDGIADGITAQSQAGKLIYANDAAARLVGYSNAAEFINTSVERVMPKFEMFDEAGNPLSVEHLPGRLTLLGQPSSPLTIRFKILETGEERWSMVKAQSVTDEDGQVVMAVNIFQDVTDLKRNEMAQRLLAEASTILDTSFDYETKLAKLAELIVPRLADWCSVDILDENQLLQRVAMVHVDPNKVAWGHEIHKRYPPDPNADGGVYRTIRTAQTIYVPAITQEMIDAVQDPELKKLVIDLGLASSIQVPLIARGRALGVLSLVWAESGHYYTPADVTLIEDLAHRASLALDNARLYMEAQNLNSELEQRVEKRTVQLQKINLRLKNEIKERKQAEKQIRSLNAVLEERVMQRTHQLESMNTELQHEIIEREQVDRALHISLQKTRELYEISQKISLMRVPADVLDALLSSSYLKSAIRATLIIFEKIWKEDAPPPVSGTVLAVVNKDPKLPRNAGAEITLSDTGLMEFYARYEPMIIADAPHDFRIIESQRQVFLKLGFDCVVIFPLIASGEKYGLLSFFFNQINALNMEDVRYLRGLVDLAATSIYNFRLLETEANARREAEEANKLKLKFLAMISHELRTPLTSIKGFATTLLATDVEWQPEDQHDFLETIDLEADKLTDLIEQLLDLSRLEAGTMRIMPQQVTWDDILSIAMAQLRTLTVHHKLVLEQESDLPLLKVDMIRIPQVITNLVNNAVKYSPANSVITISASRLLAEPFIKVSIMDEGMGIPVAERNHVFEAFQQLERQKENTKGAGLGLAICRGLLEAHGAQIWVDDHEGPGTTLSFTLPIN